MSVRGGADQADTTKPEISTDLQTSGPYNTEEMPITKLATGAAGVSALVGSGNPLPVSLDAAALAALETIQVGSLAAGTNNIGDVDVLTVPADPFGATADAVVAAGATGSISAKLRRISQTLADILALIPTALGSNGGLKVDGTGPNGRHMISPFSNQNYVTSANTLTDADSGGASLTVAGQVWNGTTYDKARGDAANGTDVDVTRIIPGTSATHLGKAEDAAHASGDTGVMDLAVRNDTQSALATTDGDYIPLNTDSVGALRVAQRKAGTATLSNVNDAATSATLLAAAAGRVGAILHNDSPSILYLKYGATASATSYSYKIAPDQHWEMPQPIYTGIIDGIWSADASGAARITELT